MSVLLQVRSQRLHVRQVLVRLPMLRLTVLLQVLSQRHRLPVRRLIVLLQVQSQRHQVRQVLVRLPMLRLTVLLLDGSQHDQI